MDLVLTPGMILWGIADIVVFLAMYVLAGSAKEKKEEH
jgi:hypothetical protein